jgi:hypothetical protein
LNTPLYVARYILFIFLCFSFPPKNITPLFFNECPQRKTLSDGWINSLFFILFITYSCYSYDVQLCLIHVESGSYIRQWQGRIRIIYKTVQDGEESGSYIRQWQGRIRIIYKTVQDDIWPWFFPVTVLYMILILPHHALSYIWSWFFPVTLIYDKK